MMLARLANVAALLVMPFLLTGLVNRVKSLWSGRKGPPIFQIVFDVARLLRKSSVYSSTTTPLFRIAPYVLLVTALGTAAITPLLGSTPLASFPFDFVWLAYAWGLGRVGVILAALDTGSSFEGMGAAREATFSALLEPVVFLVMGALCLLGGTHSLSEALVPKLHGTAEVVAWAASILALLVVLQVEAARMPVDDPTTHLELTMIHEVMVLDHSGQELAAIQVATAVKMTAVSAMIATMLNPWAGSGTVHGALANVVLCVVVAVVVGTIESLLARLRLRTVPQYIAAALVSGAIALLATAWRFGGTP